ncbi:MAG: glycosyltransferase [Bacteroidetes bacterium]|nr:glycosyltransferase [Bacteroidota bacterium]
MKILLINSYHYRKGGADAVYFNTANLLRQNGHEVYFYSTVSDQNLPANEESYFAPYLDFRKMQFKEKLSNWKSFIYNRQAHDQLLDFLETVKPDVAHIHLFLGSLSSSILQALKRMKIPIVHSVHDYRLICPAYLFLDGRNHVCERCKDDKFYNCVIHRCSGKSYAQSTILALDAYYRKYYLNPVEYIDKFIFVSQFICNKHTLYDVEMSDKSEILYNYCPDIGTLVPESRKGDYFLYFGRLSREKGIATLVKAAAKANVKLKIAGTGPWKKTIASKKYPDIEFLGYKSGDELWSLIRNASFVVIPSQWYENNPLTLIESYACGKPVIGARIGGIPEIVIEGKTGFLFKPGSSSQLSGLLKRCQEMSTEEYQMMHENATAFGIRNFNPEDYYKRLLWIYESLVKKDRYA